MQTTHETFQGLVLRDTVYKESDKLLTVLAKGKGLLTLKARGALKGTGAMAAGAQPFVFSEFTVYEFSGKLLIEKIDPIDQFEGLRKDLVSFALAGYFAELCELFGVSDTPEDEGLLRLLLNSLFALAYRPEINRQKIKGAFEMRLCAECGFAPDLECCAVCGEEPRETLFDPEAGQLFCKACRPEGYGNVYPLTPRLLAALRQITAGELKKILAFRLDAEEGAAFCRLCEEYILLQTELPESLKYYKSVLNPTI